MLIPLLHLLFALLRPFETSDWHHEMAHRACWVGVYSVLAPDHLLTAPDGMAIAQDTDELAEAVGAPLCDD